MSESREVSRVAEELTAAVGRAVVGMERELRAMIVALFAGGHVLLEGPPGTAKTLLVRSLARAIGGRFGRVQFTPDLMPSDVTGTSLFRRSEGDFVFREGPIFAQLLLCDEINRAPAKTQAALLEGMQEGAVTIDGVRHELPRPFVVFATQNPLEHEGTYPLPEAQLDRFLFQVRVRYPSEATEIELLERTHARAPEAGPEDFGVAPVTSPDEVRALREAVAAVTVRADLFPYLVECLRRTRVDGALLAGASPRAGVRWVQAAKALAAVEGRDYVSPDDLKSVAPPVLRHRLVLDPAEEIGGLTTDQVIEGILDSVEVPR